jgi:hypothetical protein
MFVLPQGPHVFMVRIRDHQFRPMPGVRIKDHGPKVGNELRSISSVCGMHMWADTDIESHKGICFCPMSLVWLELLELMKGRSGVALTHLSSSSSFDWQEVCCVPVWQDCQKHVSK